MQGGKIWVESQEDNGSTFKFEINYTKYTNTVYLSQAKETIDYNTLKGIKVLLCEDNEVNIFLAKSIMESWHMHVDVALNGRKAVEMAEKSTYDIILMDIQMPELSGLDATQLIRSNPDRIKSNVPIIALTANALKGDAEKYISVGMNDYISKPFDEKQLYLKIANTLLLNPVEKKPEPELSNKEQVNANSELLYDLSILHKMSRGNEAFIKRTKTLFIETVPQTISDINLYLQTQDWAGVSAAAHKLKSTIDTLRIEKLKEVIRQIENGAKSQNPQEAVESNIIYLNEIMAKVLEQMKADL
jgi:CheY-like chemotaxis protein